ncbi:hypothetical protein DL98DRAFT_540968 [Cadophora sp. DSE1049]|nr:hypothetical protein DL98DRAFT_540968 [Cadophora sp. DSE1049]
MAPGRHDTCPCGFVWLKDKQGVGYTCAGGQHRINGAGETPGETKWRMDQEAKKKAEEEQKAKQRAIEQRRADERVRVRVRTAPPANKPSPQPVLETEADRERRESRERELRKLRECQLRQEKSIHEAPRAANQETRSTPRKFESGGGKKESKAQLTAEQVEAGLARARQQKQKEKAQVNQKESQQRSQRTIDAEAAEERAAAWARINATKRAGPSTPAPSTQPTNRPRALPAPGPSTPAPSTQPTNRPRALPAPDPAPVVEPMPWTSAPSTKPTREREPELVRPRKSIPKEREKMPWE